MIKFENIVAAIIENNEAASAASSVVAQYIEACERMSNLDAYVFDVTIRNDEGKKLASIEVTLEKLYK